MLKKKMHYNPECGLDSDIKVFAVQVYVPNMLEIPVFCQGHALIFVEREKVAAVKTLALV